MNLEALKKYVEGITSEQSIYFLGFLVGAFLFGFILAWIIWGSRARKYRKLSKNNSSEDLVSVDELNQLKTSLTEREQLIEELDTELKQFKNKSNTNVQDQAVIEALKRDNRSLIGQISSYKTTIQELERSLQEKQQPIGKDEMNQQLNERLANIEEKISALGVVSSGNVKVPIQPKIDNSAKVAIQEVETKVEQEAQKVVDSKLGTVIPNSDFENRDDLKLINGIGPFLEKQLNDRGFFSYEQIAALDEETGRALAVAIGYLPDRVAKDGWVRQARHFSVMKTEDPNSLKRIAEYPTDVTDLQIFKGVGSKEEDTLKSNGFHNWDDVAKAGFDDINKLLGQLLESKYTSTLSQQAQMAVEGKWEKLKAFQDFLN
jgi:predicted flap endonuclease-1-like 5' DNA nuclease